MAHDLEKKWRSQDVKLEENVDFSSMLLNDRVLMGLKKAGFKKPSPIQLEAIPIAKIGKDLIVQSKSGTGKTLVFVITALEALKRKLFRPQVMILAPTREIAAQICSVMQSVASAFPKLTCCSFIGGLSINEDRDKALTCQIVVGTPGRLKQLVNEKALPVNSVRLLVFDEADQLLQMSFKQDIEDIFNLLPIDKQVIATSATYPASYRKTLLRYLRDPYLACLNSKELALLGMVQYARVVKGSPMPLLLYKTKLSVLEEILKTVKFSQCLVFCNGIQKVEVLFKDIKKWGFSTTYISSAKEQSDRLKAVDRLKRFKCKVLVSSDVTSRGIDAENVDFVINFDLPFNTETYMHRVGRAGRYGSVGVAISIIEEKEVLHLKKMEMSASFKTFKLQDPITEDLIQKARFETGEYVIECDETDSDEMLSKLLEIKPKKSTYRKNGIIEKPGSESTEEEMEHPSNTNCNGSLHFVTEPMEGKQKLLERNGVAEMVEDEKVVENIEHLANFDSNGSNYVSNNQISMKQNLTEENISTENLENEETKNAELSHNFSLSQDNCVLTEPVKIEQSLTLENCGVGNKANNLENECLSEYDLRGDDCVSHTQKLTEKNSEISSTKDTGGNIHSDVESSNEVILHESIVASKNEKLNTYELVDNDKEADKCGVKNTNAELSDLNSVVLSNRNEVAEVDRKAVNDIKITDSIDNKGENSFSANLLGSIVPQSLENKDKIFVQDDKSDKNNIQKTELCNDVEKGEINIIAKAFVDQYELNQDKIPSVLEKRNIRDIFDTVKPCSIIDLNVYKSESFYKVFKKYLGESESQTEENKTECDEICSESLQTETSELDASSSKANTKGTHFQNSAVNNMLNLLNEQNVNSDTCFQNSTSSKMSDSIIEQAVILEETAENFKQNFYKPKSESTPQLKTKMESKNHVKDLAKCDLEPVKLGMPLTVFQEVSDESDSDDTELSQDLKESEYSLESESSSNLSSDSSSDSCSSDDSEKELSSDSCSDSSSSEDSTSESSCHRKNHSRKIQNSSSVSISSKDSRNFQNLYQSGNSKKQTYNSIHGRRNCNSYHCAHSNNYPMHSSRAKNKSHYVRCAACNHSQHSTSSRRNFSAHCYLPSEHRCHVNAFCHQMPVCSQWHGTFYNQWQQIQSSINSMLH